MSRESNALSYAHESAVKAKQLLLSAFAEFCEKFFMNSKSANDLHRAESLVEGKTPRAALGINY